ncbi:S-adenosyl-L-methionine-dependent methyltransferase [Chaetomium strumarium]|uniref:S-adenosyl-L-methionine-dependent methyltransferase n=1 Tax=Chaetomium strumarium TaxID=1170767 RepID=A0AAJ0GN18_9PEZI|nr:S-adenosyl-L-methionine-dependent methyltransferase [Chaetomium strumarium]
MEASKLIEAAESLLRNAKLLARHLEGPHPGKTKRDLAIEEEGLRRKIAHQAKKIAFETAPALDVVKSDWIVVSPSSLVLHPSPRTLTKSQLADVGASHTFIDWKAFDYIPLEGEISIADLARAVDAQGSLVARFTALLLSTGKLLPGQGPNTVRHSRISPLYRTDNGISTLTFIAVGNGMRPYSNWPWYFRQYGRREPLMQNPTPFSFAWGLPMHSPWEIMAMDPDYASTFGRGMKHKEKVWPRTPLCGRGALYDFSWVGVEAEKLAQQMGHFVPVVVDVGGGQGQLVIDLIREIRGLNPGQCVLQDRREALEDAKCSIGLEGAVLQEHDFHLEQPVKGALVYILKSVLLNYSDELATHILKQLAEALPVDNPKARVIVIEDRFLDVPELGNRLVDLTMLNLRGKLRNKEMFEAIAVAAGLQVVGFYTQEGKSMCVVECARVCESAGSPPGNGDF